jgi:hypothetical protein
MLPIGLATELEGYVETWRCIFTRRDDRYLNKPFPLQANPLEHVESSSELLGAPKV